MNACPDLLAALKQRLHDLELEKALVYARASEVQEMLDLIEQPQRRRKRRTEPTEPPQHVTGAIHEPPDDDQLPFQSDAPGA